MANVTRANKKHFHAQIYTYSYCNIEIVTSKENFDVISVIHNIYEK